MARLTAERDRRPSRTGPSDARPSSAGTRAARSSEQEFFAARTRTRRGQQELAETRIAQFEKQIAGLEAQLKSNGRQMGITAAS